MENQNQNLTKLAETANTATAAPVTPGFIPFLEIDGQTFKTALQAALPFMSKNPGRFILNGINLAFNLSRNEIELQSTDGRRLLSYKIPYKLTKDGEGISGRCDPESVILSAYPLKKFYSELKKIKGPFIIQMPTTWNYKAFMINHLDLVLIKNETRLVSKLGITEGNYPNCETILRPLRNREKDTYAIYLSEIEKAVKYATETRPQIEFEKWQLTQEYLGAVNHTEKTGSSELLDRMIRKQKRVLFNPNPNNWSKARFYFNGDKDLKAAESDKLGEGEIHAAAFEPTWLVDCISAYQLLIGKESANPSFTIQGKFDGTHYDFLNPLAVITEKVALVLMPRRLD